MQDHDRDLVERCCLAAIDPHQGGGGAKGWDGVVRAVLTEAQQWRSPWRSMDTAPVDGTSVLLKLDPPVDCNAILGWAPRDLTAVVGWTDGERFRDGSLVWKSTILEEGSADTEGYSSPHSIDIGPVAWMPIPE